MSRNPFPPTPEQSAIIEAAAQSASLMVNALAGTGKALKNNQRVVTPSGYKPIGALTTSDYVAGSNGEFYPVLGVFPQGEKDLFELEFSDGAKVLASGDHVWTMRRADKKIIDVTTLQLFSKPIQDNGRSYWYLPMTQAVSFPKRNLPIDPWMLGILLGDGCLQEKSVTFSSADPIIVHKMSELASTFNLNCNKAAVLGYDYRLTNPKNLGKSNKLLDCLRSLNLAGKKSDEKFVPRDYLLADSSARLALLQGLFDSDGSACAGAVDFSSSSESLANDVKFLVESLGGTATINSRQTSHKLSHRLYIKMTQQPFTLERKMEKYTPKLAPYRALKSVRKVEKAACTCISVASPDKLFLTENFIVTHNTTTLTMLAEALPREPILALAFNKKIKEELEKRFPSNFTIMTMNGLGHKAWAGSLNKRKLFIDDRKLSRLTTEALKPFRDSQDSWAAIKMLVCHAMRRGLVPSQFQHAKGFIPDTPEIWETLDVECDAGLTQDERKLARRILVSSIEEGLEGKITFDDQVYLPVVFHGNFPRFNIVLVDEAQDLSPLNHAMLKKVCAGKLIVVGDPRQAIYAFRGADSKSMASIKALKREWIELPLNTTFRCPKAVVERQQTHAPGYVAAASNPEGQIVDWTHAEWSWDTLQPVRQGDLAMLCRNNAPLVSMAFKLIKRGIGVNMLGREIGKGLEILAKKLSENKGTSIIDFAKALEEWKETQFSLAEANDDKTKMENVQDKYECLQAVMEGKSPQTVAELLDALRAIFASEGNVILASGHKSKGLEWSTVVHLDPWRIPSKFAKKPEEIEQENNLRYVLETRTKHTLVLASVANFK